MTGRPPNGDPVDKTPGDRKRATDESASRQPQPGEKYVVYVDDNFHHMDEEERYILGEYDTAEEAIQAAKGVIDAFLLDARKPDSTPESLFSTFAQFGDDPFISGVTFSAWDYARRRCQQLCAPKS